MLYDNQILTFNLPNLTDRFLEGNGSGYIEAGLPNITGDPFTGGDGTFKPSGAFYKGSAKNIKQMYTNATREALYFDASLVSSIYGKSTTVQPPACKCYFCIKF